MRQSIRSISQTNAKHKFIIELNTKFKEAYRGEHISHNLKILQINKHEHQRHI